MSDPSSSGSVEWSPYSWVGKPIKQQPSYSDKEAADKAKAKIRGLPPLVHPTEVDSLKRQLKEVARGERFLLQGGDCAERFVDCAQLTIEAKLKIILQMSLVLVWGAKIPTVRIGRVAGQYGKPRSSPTEKVTTLDDDGEEQQAVIPSYKGDNINGFEATAEERRHNPERLVQAYFHSAATLNYIRALIKGGYADLHQARHWDLGYVVNLERRKEYSDIAARIRDSLDFMDACGAGNSSAIGTVDYFTSHEGLVLDYEAGLTREYNGRHYNTSAHYVWIGDRTRQLDGAHIEYFRGIANPIGIKVGPTMKPDEIVPLVRAVSPDNEPGRVTLITRMGAKRVAELLPPIVRAVREANLEVVWVCDPMHGNTHTTDGGIKTRHYDAILEEVMATFRLHIELGTHLGGVHFELTGENVTECIGGPEELGDDDLSTNYTSYCDPRLNYAQSMEMSFIVAKLLRGHPDVYNTNGGDRRREKDIQL